MKTNLLFLLIALLLPVPLHSAVPAFAPIFNRGAVLQCEMPANIWGTATPDADISVRLDGAQVATAKTAPDGRWQAVIPAQEPGGPHSIAAHDGETSAELDDVWFGEVWIASGQSNMVWPLRNSEGGREALAQSVPDIRFVIVPERTGLPAATKLTAAELAWREFAPPANNQFGAVPFFFADRLREETGRRVGILQNAVGGTPAQAWVPLETLMTDPSLADWAGQARRAAALSMTSEEHEKEMEGPRKAHLQAMAEWEKDRTKPKPSPPEPPPGSPFGKKTATVLWENMVVPLIPYTARGVIWYQGEANTEGPDKYRTLFPALISAWRQAWDRPDWPFLFVQLATLEKSRGRPVRGDWPGLRAAQAHTRDRVPGTGMALAIDAGERDDIHPKFKKPVGERLARLALAQVYGKQVTARGPLMTKATNEGGKIMVAFEHTGDGLKTSDGQPEIPGFEMAASDGKFHAATARLAGPATVALECAAVPDPVSVRYAWAPWIEPPVTLQNSDSFPAEPGELALTGAD
jgi:sialate O-acetylesterase